MISCTEHFTSLGIMSKGLLTSEAPVTLTLCSTQPLAQSKSKQFLPVLDFINFHKKIIKCVNESLW